MVAKESTKLASIIIQEQAKVLIRIAYPYKDNIDALRKRLSEYKVLENKTFTIESISFALEHMNNNPAKFSLGLREEINDLLLARRSFLQKEETFVHTEIAREEPLIEIPQKKYENIAEYMKLNSRLPGSLDFFMKMAIDVNDIEEIKHLHSLNATSGLPRIKINDSSPLEYALALGKNDLALEMMQAGFVLNHRSKVDRANVHDAIKNIIERGAGRKVVQEILDGKTAGLHQVRSINR